MQAQATAPIPTANCYSSLKLVLLLAAFLTVPFTFDRDFSTRGEPREAIVVQSMVDQGKWLVGEGYGGVVPSKPPVMHWVGAALSELSGGVSEATVRLPSVIASLLAIGALYGFISLYRSQEIAAVASLILISSFEWARAASAARVDMILSAFMFGALAALFHWYEAAFRRVPWLALFCLIGAGLTKGPVGIGLPVMIFGVFILSQRALTLNITFKIGLLVLCAMIGVGAWYLAGYAQDGQPFLERAYYENWARFTSSQEDKPHKHSAMYLLGTLLLGMLPWTWMVLFTAWRNGPKRWVASLLTWWRNLTPAGRLAVISAAGVFLFFCIPSGKRSAYLLPAYPFLAWGLGELWTNRLSVAARVFAVRLIVGLMALLWLLITMVAMVLKVNRGELPLGLVKTTEDFFLYLAQQLVFGHAGLASMWWFFLISICGWAWLYVARTKSAVVPIAMVALGLAGVNGSMVAVSSNNLSSRPFAQQLKMLVSPTDHLVSYQNELYGVGFYLDRRIDRFDPSALSDTKAVFLMFDRNLEKFKREISAQQKVEFVVKALGFSEDPLGRLIAVRVG